ncbi:hypothetical protein A8926_0158 [Saccharopolyspora spinosa]|uniref:Uncharacterized protein n=2 Tax=Saccharopolyspora spinosa TaxID=60894 RepID=A0A2N3XPY8_SACSN|nr:hypothetical protein A8926_0158 [Saccharopolyspora spinosa]
MPRSPNWGRSGSSSRRTRSTWCNEGCRDDDAGHKKHRDELLIALRMHEISGERVGEVLAEVEAHVTETGEDPVEAFGRPREYAAQVAEQLDRNTGKRSGMAVMASATVTAVTMFGSDYLLDGLFADTARSRTRSRAGWRCQRCWC